MKLFVDPFGIIIVIAICVAAGVYLQTDKEILDKDDVTKQEGK